MTQTNDPPTVLDIGLIPNSNEKADLDAPSNTGGKLIIGQAPNITITETNVVADADERLALDVQEGDIAIQTNVSTSFIFTGGDNVANNWETLDFDAVGAIDGEDITPSNITASGDISLQDLTVAGAINGADTSAAAAGEALTSDGNGGFGFASLGGIEEAATFDDLPAADPPQLGYVIDEEQYYRSFPIEGSPFDISFLSDEAGLDIDNITYASGLAFSNDGTKLVVIILSPDIIQQYDLSTPFDVRSASFDTDIPTQDSRPQGVEWNDDGTRLYEVGDDSQKIYQSTVSTPFDISTASFDTDIPTQDVDAFGIAWNNDGSRLYEAGNNSNKIYQYTVSTPFDISTASFDTDISTQDSNVRDITWNDDGTRLYELGRDQRKIYQYNLSTPFEITSASFDTSNAAKGGVNGGIVWNNDGTRLYESNQTFGVFQSVPFEGGWEAFS